MRVLEQRRIEGGEKKNGGGKGEGEEEVKRRRIGGREKENMRCREGEYEVKRRRI